MKVLHIRLIRRVVLEKTVGLNTCIYTMGIGENRNHQGSPRVIIAAKATSVRLTVVSETFEGERTIGIAYLLWEMFALYYYHMSTNSLLVFPSR